MKHIKWIADVLLYIITFFMIQLLLTYVVIGIEHYMNTHTLTGFLSDIEKGTSSRGLVIISAVSSLLTILLFCRLRWARLSGNYLRRGPWVVFIWTALLALGTIIPSEYMAEQMPYEMPSEMEALLSQLMGDRWGYMAIGILVPVAEEVVFRGAVLRRLLQVSGQRWHWLAIALSAVAFGAAHGNLPQFIHATLIGLIIGWLYYRTNSIAPGVLFHWANNTVAYVAFNLMGNNPDAQLIDLFGGNSRSVIMAVAFSLCIILPSLYQLHLNCRR